MSTIPKKKYHLAHSFPPVVPSVHVESIFQLGLPSDILCHYLLCLCSLVNYHVQVRARLQEFDDNYRMRQMLFIYFHIRHVSCWKK